MADKPEAKETPEAKIARLEEELVKTRAAQSGVDRVYQVEKRRADALEARILTAGSEADLRARLEKIQRGYAEKERRLELRYYAREKCLDSGISFDLLSDLEFKDEPAIERKVAQISEAITAKSLTELDARLAMSSKPQTGPGRPERTLDALDQSFKSMGLK